ncbi:MAG: hypothetical protein NW206_20005 [Hyphomonadaceae bacterium]|nr:hypothetical protein [Hyphomonadaceae bacterium]
MGGCTFSVVAKGATAQEAFDRATSEARYENGHGGYTGTIAEKDSFVVIALPEGIEAEAYADQLIENRDERVDDKWGPAGAIKLSHDEWLFFGWASS